VGKIPNKNDNFNTKLPSTKINNINKPNTNKYASNARKGSVENKNLNKPNILFGTEKTEKNLYSNGKLKFERLKEQLKAKDNYLVQEELKQCTFHPKVTAINQLSNVFPKTTEKFNNYLSPNHFKYDIKEKKASRNKAMSCVLRLNNWKTKQDEKIKKMEKDKEEIFNLDFKFRPKISRNAKLKNNSLDYKNTSLKYYERMNSIKNKKEFLNIKKPVNLKGNYKNASCETLFSSKSIFSNEKDFIKAKKSLHEELVDISNYLDY